MKDLFSSHPTVEHGDFVERVQARLADLPRQEARVAQYMLLNRDDLVFQTGVSIARQAGASQVTVSRLLSRLGYRGMAGLKRELQARRASAGAGLPAGTPPDAGDQPLQQARDADMRAVLSVYEQAAGKRWANAVRLVAGARSVFVTGFQTVRGAAEDFARRLALVRDEVRFLSAHDGVLGEWIGDEAPRSGRRRDCLVIIDVVPYAQEAPLLAEMSAACGRGLVVLTDEFCHWAQPHTDYVFHAPSKNGLVLESTGALVTLANVLANGVAEHDPSKTERRLRRWQAITRKLNVF